jgi:hypothetical protein
MFSRRAVGGGVLLVHSEIYYVPIGDGWEEVLVRDVLHYVRTSLCTNNTPGFKEFRYFNQKKLSEI